jgi:hypothetical protein
MGIEDGGLVEVHVEQADDEDEACPCCEADDWVRAIAVYPKGACWVIYCGGCGKVIQQKWNIIP